MRCKICDRDHAEYVYDDWHCGSCTAAIKESLYDHDDDDLLDDEWDTEQDLDEWSQ